LKILEIRINQYFDYCDKEYDTRRWAHGELYEEEGKKYCSECFNRQRSRGCILVSGDQKKKAALHGDPTCGLAGHISSNIA